MITFAANLLGGAGVAGAQAAKTCVPQPAFVYGGDPTPSSLTTDNTARWTGGAAYGWNSGSVTEVSYEIALANNSDANVGTQGIENKWLILSFFSTRSAPQVDGSDIVRVGFDYPYTGDAVKGPELVSQIISWSFDAADISNPWVPKPPICGPGVTGLCANDPTNTAITPDHWTSFTPAKIQTLQKLTQTPSGKPPVDNATTTWTADTSWIKSHSWAWIFADTSGGAGKTKYYWRLNIALPVRTDPTAATIDPGQSWTVPAIYLDKNVFTKITSTNKVTNFWAEIFTDAAAGALKAPYHFPDWTATQESGSCAGQPWACSNGRDSSNIPAKLLWGNAELGSPRDPSQLAPGELSCTGQGLVVEGTAGDDVVYHSAIWNKYNNPNGNTSGLFDAGGTLYMYDTTHSTTATNNLSVKLKNFGGGKSCTTNTDCNLVQNGTTVPGQCNTTTGFCDVTPSSVHASFLIAPYGSQAAKTVWSPLNEGFNDYTCTNSDWSPTSTNNCTPLPSIFKPIDSTPTSGTASFISQGSELQLDMAKDWHPAPNYVCAVQNMDNPGSIDWYYDTLGTGTNQYCSGAIWTPKDKTGTAGNPSGISAGLPGHQCLQVQLTGDGVQFATKSAFRNMHQATASLYRQIATIDTKGLPKVAGQSYHYIYLYVETHNMPYRVDSGYAPKTYGDAMSDYKRMNTICTAQCNGCIDANGACQSGSTNDACGTGGGQCAVCGQGQFCSDVGVCEYQITARVSSPLISQSAVGTKSVVTKAAAALPPACRGFDPSVPAPSEDWFTKNMPTFIVHAYADTGVTEVINGKKVPILTPMTSFGQWITHDSSSEGNIFGWDAGLEPVGTTQFQKVGVDTYRIRVPNDGAGQVVTHVEPLPTKRPTCTGTVNEDIVTLLKAIAPLITVSPEDAGEINALIDSLQIECVDLQDLLTSIDNGNWGAWQSWVHYLVTQVEATDGCQCN